LDNNQSIYKENIMCKVTKLLSVTALAIMLMAPYCYAMQEQKTTNASSASQPDSEELGWPPLAGESKDEMQKRVITEFFKQHNMVVVPGTMHSTVGDKTGSVLVSALGKESDMEALQETLRKNNAKARGDISSVEIEERKDADAASSASASQYNWSKSLSAYSQAHLLTKQDK
jgi:hypothetical protein